MSKRRIFPCPGCGLPFTEGRSFSQHLVWNPACKGPSGSRPIPQVGASPSEVDTNIDADVVRTSDCVNDDTDAYPDNLSIDESLNADDGPEEMTVDSHLQNVVSFPVAFTNAALHEVELLKILHKIGAPNQAFESLMGWARDAAGNDYHFQPSPQRYESQIHNLTDLVGMTACRPTISQVSLEPDDLVLDVVVFPFATMLASLLNCPMLNKLENLVVNSANRYGRYRSPGGILNEVNSAQWYQDTYDKVIDDPDKEFLCPIIFAMDKTVISEISHLSVHVILFTTTIFNREVRMIQKVNLLLLF
jgi:hypothetical protein